MTPQGWLLTALRKYNEKDRSIKVAPFFIIWTKAQRYLSRQGERGRNAQPPGGMMGQINKIIQMNPYISFGTLTKLFPFYLAYADKHEKLT